jgi:hypothetical protein
MARPTKEGLSYFPLDVDLDQDDKLAMIIGEFGEKGELLFIKLCAWIYKHGGYNIHWDEKEQLKFAKRVAYIGGSSANLCNEVVARCIKWGIFNESVFKSFQILTSPRIQTTWLDATRKRKERSVDPKIWLLPAETTKDLKNFSFWRIKPEETGKKAEETPQSKVKESKEEESNKENSAHASQADFSQSAAPYPIPNAPVVSTPASNAAVLQAVSDSTAQPSQITVVDPNYSMGTSSTGDPSTPRKPLKTAGLAAKEGWVTKPLPTHIHAPPEGILQAICERQHQKGNPGVTQADVLAYWRSWVPIEANGEKFYRTQHDVYKHFNNRCEQVAIKPVPLKTSESNEPKSHLQVADPKAVATKYSRR